MNLTEKWHGAPVWVWAAGGTITSAGLVYLYKKHKASASTTQAVAPDSSGIASSGSLPFGGGGSGSDSGPLGDLGDLVGNFIPPVPPVTDTPDPSATAGPGANNPPQPDTPKGVADVVTQAIQSLTPLSIVVPTPVAASTAAPPPPIGIIPNPIAGDTSTVARGEVSGGFPVTYGGNPTQAQELVDSSYQQGLVDYFSGLFGGNDPSVNPMVSSNPLKITTPGQLVGPASNGAQRYVTPSGETFVAG